MRSQNVQILHQTKNHNHNENLEFIASRREVYEEKKCGSTEYNEENGEKNTLCWYLNGKIKN